MKQNILTLARPKQTVNFASFFITKDTQPGILVRRTSTVTLKRRAVAPDAPTLQLDRAKRGPAKLTALNQRKLSVGRVAGSMSQGFGRPSLTEIGSAELKIPGGIPRFVNAATLKRMLKAAASDTLFKRVGSQWEVCENSARIDLLDDSVEFRLGTIQIYS